MSERPFTPENLAERWRCNKRRIYELVDRGRLQAFRLGIKLMRIPASEVERFEAEVRDRNNGLRQPAELREQAQPFKLACGIYFLFLNGELVYIGKSIKIQLRVARHQNEGAIKFDAVTWIEAPEDDLEALELQYISAFKPKGNFQGTRRLA